MQVCSDPAPMHCSPAQGKCIPHCPVLLCKTGSQQACVTAVTPMKICSSYRCAVASTNACSSVQGKLHSRCSVLLCKPGSQQAVCHCSYTYGDLIFIQVSNGPPQMPCSSVQGKLQLPQFSAALQSRLTAGSVSRHLWSFALHTGVQCASTNALQLCSTQHRLSMNSSVMVSSCTMYG